MSTSAPVPFVDDSQQAAPPATPTPSGIPYAASPPQPVTPENPNPGEQPTIPQQDAPQAPVSARPVVLTPAKRGGLLGVMDDIANVLVGGQTKPEFANDQDGNKYVKETTLSRGEQWRRIAGEAFEGAAAGLAAGKGAGNMGKAPLAGIEAEKASAQQRQQQEQNMTAEARQENIDRGNRVLQNMQLTKLNWDLTNAQHEASQNDVKFYRGQLDDYVKQGGQVLGTARDPKDISHILNSTPDAVQQMIQHGTIVPVAAVDDDGKRIGTTFIRMPDNYATEMLPAGAKFPVWNGLTHQVDYQNSADPITKAQFQSYSQAAALQAQTYADAQHKQMLEDQKQKSETNLQSAEASKNRADAGKAVAETKALNQASSTADIQNNARQLVDGQIDPANLSKRSKSYDATLAAANAYSMQQYGRPFDVAKAAGDYKFATNTNTYNTLNFLNSLVGHDNRGGNLGVLVSMSNNLPRTEFPPINAVEQWAKLSAGNPQVAAYRAGLVEVSDQVAKILQGGGTGSGTSDAKLKQATDVLNKNFTADQFAAVANDTLRPLLANRKLEMIGTNRYLQQWNGAAPQQQTQAPQTFSLSRWKLANPNGDAAAAQAAAQAKGFQVVQ